MKCNFSGVSAKYDTLVNEYADKSHNYISNKKETDIFLSLLPENALILDAGCGPGNFTHYFRAKKFGYIGIDFSKEMLKFAKKEYCDANFACMDLRKLGFRKAAFDGIYLSYSFLHIPKKDAKSAIMGFKNIMRPGGAIMLVLKEGRGEKPIGINAKPDMGIEHSLWTLPEMNKLLSACGFEINYSDRWMPTAKKPNALIMMLKKLVLKREEKPKCDITANHGTLCIIARKRK